MNEQQQQAIAEVREKIAKEAAPEEADTQAKKNVAGEIDRTLWDDIVGAAGKVASGATFGYADELRAFVRSRLPEIYGDKTYEEHLGEARGVLEEFGEAHSKTAFGLELAGGAGTGGIGAAKVLGMKAIQNAPKLAQYLTSGGIGAGQGAVAGSGYAKEGERLKGAGIGAAIGGPLGVAIPAAIGGVSRLAMPRSSAGGSAQKLIQEGISLTPGQRMGGVTQSIEDFATSLPVVGTAVKGAQRRGIDDFNRAAINRALSPIGQKLDDNTPVGRTGIDEMLTKLSGAYDDLLPNVRFQADIRFRSEISELADMVKSIEKGKFFKKYLDDNVINKLGSNGEMRGETFKKVESELTKKIRSYNKPQASGADTDLRDALIQTRRLLREGLERSPHNTPEQGQFLQKINKAWSRSQIVEDAAGSPSATVRTTPRLFGTEEDISGVFTASDLNRAVRRAAGRRKFARGKGEMQDLSDPATQRLSQTIGESGTTPRALAALGLLGGGAQMIDPFAATLTGLAGLGYTRPGQKVINWALSRGANPQFAPKLAGGIRALQAPGIGAGAIYGGRR
jgi:hypothetical protein